MTIYGEYLSQLKASTQAAYEYIPKMCHALREEDSYLANTDIRDRVTKDCLEAGLAKSTITHNIPKEFKDPDKVRAGKRGAQKKKIVLSATTSGAADTAAENWPIAPIEPELRRSKLSSNQVNNDIQAGKSIVKSQDIELLKRELDKSIEENQLKNIEIEDLRKEKEQLSEVVKKNSFAKASNFKPRRTKKFDFPEPDENNTFVWKNITFDEFRAKLGPLKAISNTKINVYLERIIL